MKLIELTQGKKAIVDDCDSHLSSFKWFCRKNGRNYYAALSLSLSKGKNRSIHMHHFVLGYPLNKLEVDHINGNGLDNRRENLRIVTHRENMANRIERRLGKTSSIFIGVCWDKKNKKWMSNIALPNGKRKFLGHFINEIDAHSAYENKLKEIKGE